MKEGLVQGANCTPLGDPELDNQGRCVMTDHGTFVIFNVYVPNKQGEVKMKFLNALHAAMKKQRDEGKHVMLLGDMNLKVDKRDIPWKSRSLNVDEILGQMTRKSDGEGGDTSFPSWKRDIAKHWGKIETVLQTIEVRLTDVHDFQ